MSYTYTPIRLYQGEQTHDPMNPHPSLPHVLIYHHTFFLLSSQVASDSARRAKELCVSLRSVSFLSTSPCFLSKHFHRYHLNCQMYPPLCSTSSYYYHPFPICWAARFLWLLNGRAGGVEEQEIKIWHQMIRFQSQPCHSDIPLFRIFFPQLRWRNNTCPTTKGLQVSKGL